MAVTDRLVVVVGKDIQKEVAPKVDDHPGFCHYADRTPSIGFSAIVEAMFKIDARQADAEAKISR